MHGVGAGGNTNFMRHKDSFLEVKQGKICIFEPMGKSADGGNIARFCTSWATTEEEVQTLIDDLKAL